MPETTAAHVEDELASQPDCWSAAIASVDRFSAALPDAGERVAVVGCGTSLYMSRAYAALREGAGHGETDAFAASEYRSGRTYDRFVGISRSGTTTELVELIDRLGPSTRTTVITADAATPAAARASNVIELSMAAERSVVQTRFPTTVLCVLRAALGEDLGDVVAGGRSAVTDPLPVEPAAAHQFTFLGLDWAAAIADEAALKCREAAGAWTESYPAMEYRHGPISVSGEGTVVWMFGAAPPGLADDAVATGATFVDDDLDPMVDLIRDQRLAVGLARQNGLDPDRPRSLSFSVVLQPGQF